MNKDIKEFINVLRIIGIVILIGGPVWLLISWIYPESGVAFKGAMSGGIVGFIFGLLNMLYKGKLTKYLPFKP